MGKDKLNSRINTGESEIGTRFQRETKYSPDKMGGHALDWNSIPGQYKQYESPIAIIQLPEPLRKGETNLWNLLLERRSRREYNSGRSVPLAALSSLLWATQGLTARYGDTFFRTAPSAGGLFPVETYVSVRAVDGLHQGLYHFRPLTFDLEFLQTGDLSKDLTEAALRQDLILDAQITFIWSAIIARSRWKYRQRAYRYIYLDAGHIAQNLYLAAESLGLGACAIGAFYDDEVNRILSLDGTEETVIYMASVGWPAETKNNR
ncbi:MAG TPA: SagB/ThcOx family dehydrogenase [Syntrophorhabdaceae bacterium]|nr:SagB/ThcOx family dehydrogenase [Syntrophorhabdaceae bacterium]HQM80040.1 SagB/ThcOx family dehydrogenase [Syntrophorhabdaceae bacterium]